MSIPEAVDIYDTTLRDGSQQEGLSLTVDDKLRVAAQLDELGVAYIEGGWPGANPKDDEFFQRAPSELKLSTSTLVAFGATRRPGHTADTDETLRHVVKANTSTVCIVAKAWDRHVREALRTELDEAVAMAAKAAEVPKTTWIRQAIEMALAVQAEDDQPISRAEALRALTLLRPARHVA
jgi:2-isopropylmalate synthase